MVLSPDRTTGHLFRTLPDTPDTFPDTFPDTTGHHTGHFTGHHRTLAGHSGHQTGCRHVLKHPVSNRTPRTPRTTGHTNRTTGHHRTPPDTGHQHRAPRGDSGNVPTLFPQSAGTPISGAVPTQEHLSQELFPHLREYLSQELFTPLEPRSGRQVATKDHLWSLWCTK